MTDTRDKLDEVRYFLARMRETQADRDVFRYNLSAFLAASRSVVGIAHQEYKGKPKFAEWGKAKLKELQRKGTPSALLMQKRDMTIHERTVQPDHGHYMFTPPPDYLVLTDSATIILIHDDGTIGQVETTSNEPPSGPPEAPRQSGPTTDARWFFTEFPNTDIVTLCEQHVALLDGVVSECEARFGP